MCMQIVVNAAHAVNDNILHTRKTYFDLMVAQQEAVHNEALANFRHDYALIREQDETATKIQMNQSRMEVKYKTIYFIYI